MTQKTDVRYHRRKKPSGGTGPVKRHKRTILGKSPRMRSSGKGPRLPREGEETFEAMAGRRGVTIEHNDSMPYNEFYDEFGTGYIRCNVFSRYKSPLALSRAHGMSLKQSEKYLWDYHPDWIDWDATETAMARR